MVEGDGPQRPDGEMEAERSLIRHLLATFAFRTRLCLTGAPTGFADFDAGAGTRTPADLVRHMTGLMHFAHGLLVGLPRPEIPALGWEAELSRLEEALRGLDRAVADAGSWAGDPRSALQGPLADALTHTGQLALLRRLAGAPIEGRNYARAPVAAGNLALRG